MQTELLAIPTGGVRYYGSRKPTPADQRVEAECSKNPDCRTSGFREPEKSEVQPRKEMIR